MENITIFGDGYMDETVDMLYYSENDITNPKFLGNIFPFIGRDVIEKFYEYGIMGENKIDDFYFLKNLNEFRETYEIFNIIPLTSYTILIRYWFKRKNTLVILVMMVDIKNTLHLLLMVLIELISVYIFGVIPDFTLKGNRDEFLKYYFR